uniref:Uncharacterized protein n=1 Tax=Rhizophora mucronata TaxID=61149 RepID=A0A2P2NRA6_RHIMU
MSEKEIVETGIYVRCSRTKPFS